MPSPSESARTQERTGIRSRRGAIYACHLGLHTKTKTLTNHLELTHIQQIEHGIAMLNNNRELNPNISNKLES